MSQSLKSLYKIRVESATDIGGKIKVGRLDADLLSRTRQMSMYAWFQFEYFWRRFRDRECSENWSAFVKFGCEQAISHELSEVRCEKTRIGVVDADLVSHKDKCLDVSMSKLNVVVGGILLKYCFWNGAFTGLFDGILLQSYLNSRCTRSNKRYVLISSK